MDVKKGDIVGRLSYGKDIHFYVDRIIKIKNTNKSYAILKGVQYRIEADAPLDDLEKIDKEQIESEDRGFENKLKQKIKKQSKILFSKEINKRNSASGALILHLDGDKKYTQKSERYYNKLGLRAIVKNVPENRQPIVIGSLVRKYNPDIIVITRA